MTATTPDSALFPTGWTADGPGLESSLGTGGLRLATAGTAQLAGWRRSGMSPLDLTGKALRVRLRVDDPARLHRLSMRVGTAKLVDSFEWLIYRPDRSTSYVQPDQSVSITLTWAQVSSRSGAFTVGARGLPSQRSGFTDIEFMACDSGAGGVTVWLEAVDIVADSSSAFPSGIVSITFDDSWLNQYRYARPIMDTFGFRGTAYTICDLIGDSSTANRMGLGELRSLSDFSQWEIAGHAYSAANHGAPLGFASLTAAEVDRDFALQKQWLAQHGFPSQNTAYPKGHFEKTADGVYVHEIAERYFATGRTIVPMHENLAPAERSKVRALTGINDGVGVGGSTVAGLVADGGPLDRCVVGGSWLILCVHNVIDGTPKNSAEISTKGLQRVCEEIKVRGLQVLPVNEVLGQRP